MLAALGLLALLCLLLTVSRPAMAEGPCGPEVESCTSEPLSANPDIPAVNLTTGRDIAPFTPLVARGGEGELAFEALPELPAGLMLDARNGQIRGRPQQPGNSQHQIRVSDAAGSSQMMELSITIADPAALTSLTAQAGSFSPAFSPDVHDYVLTLPGGTDRLSLTASHDGASANYALQDQRHAFGADGRIGPLQLPPGDVNLRLLVSNGWDETEYAIRLRRAGLQQAQSIRFAPLPDMAYSRAAIPLSASASSGLPVSLRSQSPDVCEVEANASLILRSAGTCSLIASQPGNSIYAAADDVTQSFTVARAASDFSITAPATSLKQGESLQLAAMGGAGSPEFSLDDGAQACKVNPSGLVTGLQPGNCTLRATSPGDASTLPATASLRLEVLPAQLLAAPALQLSASPRFLLTGQSAKLSASGGAGNGALHFKIDSGPCLLQADMLTGLAAGECWVSATQAADGQYAAQTAAAILITVTGPARVSLAEPDLPVTLSAQLENSASLTATQFSNVAKRLDGLNGARAGFAFDLGFANHDDALSWMPPSVMAARKADRLAFGHAAMVNEDARASLSPEAAPQAPRAEPRLAGWINGTLTHGSQQGVESFTTAGVTLGADMRITPMLTLGTGIGYGETHSEDDPSGTDSQLLSAMAYGKWRLGENGELDVVAGLGSGRFDVRRWSSGGASLLAGTRDAAQAFGSIRYGQQFTPAPGITLTPSLRLEALRMQLGAYGETGAPLWALQFDAITVSSLAAVPGLKAQMSIRHPWGTLTPQARVEYRQSLDSGYRQGFNHANFPGPAQTVEQQGRAKGAVLAGLSVKAQGTQGWSADFSYDFTADVSGSQDLVSHSLELMLRKEF